MKFKGDSEVGSLFIAPLGQTQEMLFKKPEPSPADPGQTLGHSRVPRQARDHPLDSQ